MQTQKKGFLVLLSSGPDFLSTPAQVLRALSRMHPEHICPRAPLTTLQMSTCCRIATHLLDVKQR